MLSSSDRYFLFNIPVNSGQCSVENTQNPQALRTQRTRGTRRAPEEEGEGGEVSLFSTTADQNSAAISHTRVFYILQYIYAKTEALTCQYNKRSVTAPRRRLWPTE